MSNKPTFSMSTGFVSDDADTLLANQSTKNVRLNLLADDPVPAHLARLEVVILLIMGGFGSLFITALYPERVVLWWLIALSFAMGAAAHFYPARQQLVLLARACTLVLAAIPVYLYLNPAQFPPFFIFWIGVPAFFYSLLLRPAYAAVIALAGLSLYSGALWFHPSSAPVGQPLSLVIGARAATITLLSLIAAYFGQRLRQTDEALERLRTDKETGLLNARGFQYYGEMLIAHTRKKADRTMSLAVLACDDLTLVQRNFGRQAVNMLTLVAAQRLRRIARSKGGFAVNMGHNEFVCMLPQTSVLEMQRLLGKEFMNLLNAPIADAQGSETRTIPCEVLFTVESLSDQDESIQDLLHRVDVKLMEVRLERMSDPSRPVEDLFNAQQPDVVLTDYINRSLPPHETLQ
jgi:GGDEF domain-containing protein